MKRLLAPLLSLSIAAGTCGLFLAAFHVGTASAQTALIDASTGSGSAVVVTGGGSGSAVAVVTTTTVTAPVIPADPLANVGETYDDLKAAKRLGWGIFALALIIVATRLLGRLGGMFAPLAQGKIAITIGAIGALALTAYNAIAAGGTWIAALAAGIVAGAAAWDAASKTTTTTTTTTTTVVPPKA